MKRYSHIFEQITDMETLKYAYQKALKGKRNRRDAIEFMMNSHKNLLEIQEELLNDTYIMSPYHKFYIADPKKRLIMSLPFKDRVVQWSIFAVINPIFEKRFISTSYACRVGGGTHAAIDKLQEYVQINGKEGYVLKMDISKYFYRVVHEKLYQIIANTIKDTRALKLLADIIYCQEPLGIALDDILLTGERESGLGLPIGNLTSQMFANIYLNELDQFAKHELKTKYYVRYMDDMVISRFDAHMGVANVTLTRCTFGYMGVQAVGFGTMLIKNCEVHRNTFVWLRDDYGSTWEGDIVIRDCTLRPIRDEKNLTLISGINTGTHDFGYPCHLPRHVLVENLTVDDSAVRNGSYSGPTVFGHFKREASASTLLPYTPPETVTLKNVKTVSGKPFMLSSNTMLFKDTQMKTKGKGAGRTSAR